MASKDDLSQARYTRWQGLALAQFSVAIGLISALAVTGVGAGLSLVQSPDFMSVLIWKRTFAISIFLLYAASTFALVTVVARTLDFRLTARKARGASSGASRSATFLKMGPATLGKVSWGCFWISCALLVFGGIALAFSVACTYLPLLW